MHTLNILTEDGTQIWFEDEVYACPDHIAHVHAMGFTLDHGTMDTDSYPLLTCSVCTGRTDSFSKWDEVAA